MNRADDNRIVLQKRATRRAAARIRAGKSLFYGGVYDMEAKSLRLFCNRIIEPKSDLMIDVTPMDRPAMTVMGKAVWIRSLPQASRYRRQVGVRLLQTCPEYDAYAAELARFDGEQRSRKRLTDVLGIDGEEDLAGAVTLDVSSKGLYVRTGAPLEIGREIDFRLHGDGLKKPLKLKGKVVNVFACEPDDLDLPYGAGMKITDFDCDDETLYVEYLKTLEAFYLVNLPENAQSASE